MNLFDPSPCLNKFYARHSPDDFSDINITDVDTKSIPHVDGQLSIQNKMYVFFEISAIL